MKNRGSKASSSCYCAFCKSTRVVYRKKHIGTFDVALVFFASVLLSYIIWQAPDPRATLVFAFALSFCEMFIMLRRRLSLTCPRCGFDPLLYKRSPKEAAEKVSLHMAKRKADPMSLFAPPPDLPYRKVTPPKRKPGESRPRAGASR